jgi:hypothetical protein
MTTTGIVPLLHILHIEIPIKILFGENLLRQKKKNNKKYDKNSKLVI